MKRLSTIVVAFMLLIWACNNQRKAYVVPNPRLADVSVHEIDSAAKDLDNRISVSVAQLNQIKKSATFIRQGLIAETSADPVHQ